MITIEEAKRHINLTHNQDDSLIDSLIDASVQNIADYTGLVMASTTYAEVFDGFSDVMTLKYAPLTSLTSITYLDTDGAEQTLSSTIYKQDTRRTLARVVRVYGQSWPSTLSGDQQTVTINYTAGYTAATAPKPLKVAGLMIFGSLYESRENHSAGIKLESIPVSAQYLMAPYRVLI